MDVQRCTKVFFVVKSLFNYFLDNQNISSSAAELY